MRREWLLPVLLGLAATALTGTIVLELRAKSPDSVRVSSLPAPAPPPIPPHPQTAGASPAASWSAAILARPLFAPSRRPPAGPAAPGIALASLPRITGTMVTPAGRSVIFAVPGGKPVVVGEGGHLGPYTIRRIAAGLVTVDGPGGTRTLGPAFDPNPHAPAATLTPAPPGFAGIPGLPPQPRPAFGQVPR